MTETTTQQDVESFAPKAESYLSTPKFKYAPNQKQIDFAQIVAAGGDIVNALSISSLITEQEKTKSDRAKLYQMASRLLQNPAIQERLDYYTLLHKASMSVAVERIQQELAAVSFSDFAQLCHEKDGPIVSVRNEYYDPGNPESKEFIEKYEYRAGDPIRNPHHLPRHIRAAVKSWHFDKDGILKFKLHDKLKATQMLGDLEGHFDEANRAKATQVNVSIGDGRGMEPQKALPENIEEAEIVDDSLPDCLK
jgi:hypothetical protein